MSLESILNQLEALEASFDRDITNTRKEFSKLNNIYRVYVPEQKAHIESLDKARRRGEVDLNEEENNEIKSLRSTLQTTQIQRSALANYLQSYLMYPDSVNSLDNIVNLIGTVEQMEQDLDSASARAETLSSEIYVSGRPAVTRFEIVDEQIPYGKPFDVELKIKNVGNSILDGITTTIYSNTETPCESINFGSLASNSSLKATIKIQAQKAGEQVLRAVCQTEHGHQIQSIQKVEAMPKQGAVRQTIYSLRSLHEIIEEDSNIGDLRGVTMKKELQGAIKSAEEAERIAQQDPGELEISEITRADRVNTNIKSSASFLEQFEREYAIYRKNNNISANIDRGVSRYSSTSHTYLEDGKEAGLRGSRKTGSTQKSWDENPSCEIKPFVISGRRVHDRRFFIDGESTRINIYIDRLNNADEVTITDSIPAEWNLLHEYGDDQGIDQDRSDEEHTVINLGTVKPNDDENVSEVRSYFVEPPEKVEESGYFNFGPAKARRTSHPGKSESFGGSEHAFVLATSDDGA